MVLCFLGLVILVARFGCFALYWFCLLARVCWFAYGLLILIYGALFVFSCVVVLLVLFCLCCGLVGFASSWLVLCYYLLLVIVASL